MTKKNEGAIAPVTQKQTPAVVDANKATPSERFTAMVIREFAGAVAGAPQLSAHQKRLIQNYFVSTDLSLKAAEEKRLKKPGKYKDEIPVTWENVNMPSLSLSVVACAKIGFDPALPNHINMIPYKNNNTQKYDIGFLEGYRGKELKAMKYGYNKPDDVVVEVVYSNDKFKPLKKDKNNTVESYIFEIEDAFNRGEIVGGFYYHVYSEQPHKNLLVTMSKQDIEKRKPKYAAAEFWGGTKPIYVNGKKTTKTEKVDGWYAEMVWKTIYRAAYNAITIDSEKIDKHLMALMQGEQAYDDYLMVSGDVSTSKTQEIEEKGNKKSLSIDDAKVVADPKQQEPATTLNDVLETMKTPEPQAEHPMTPNEAFDVSAPDPGTDKAAEDKAYDDAMADANADAKKSSGKVPF